LGATVELGQLLEPLRSRPDATAVVCDIDGTLAPIVARAEEAAVPPRARAALRALGRRYALVACLSGRQATEARRIVGLDELTYAGNHGLELLAPGAAVACTDSRLGDAPERVRAFAAAAFDRELQSLGVRLEDKDAISALHYRGAPDEQAARTALEAVAAEAQRAGLYPHWGRKVLELRPPVAADKGTAITALLADAGVAQALFGGDDNTDLDAFRALRRLQADGRLELAVCVGVDSAEGPAAIPAEADVVVEGPEGFVSLLEQLCATPTS
jgi:trehalose 6-phosphate phosphatase